MADYQLTATDEPCAVIRSDGACIPPDMANRDYNGDAMQPGYVQWKEAGGVPDPVPLALDGPHYTWGPTIFETVGGQDYVGA